ncbi:MAG: ATP-binding protein [Thermocrispum sp.]
MTDAYRQRHVDPVLADFLSELPAIMIVGPRAVGKTTTAARHAETVVRLDDDNEAAAYRADPDAMLAGLKEPILIDEWQAVPGVLGAVKRAVDNDSRPGRFLITGSVRADLDSQMWPGTGRAVRLNMSGLSVAEINREVPGIPVLDRLPADGVEALKAPAHPPDLREYVDLALRGGFPEPGLRFSGRARTAWFDSYLEQLVTRDVERLDGGRDPDRLRRYLQLLAMNTAGVTQASTLYTAAGVNQRTAGAYEQLLRNLLILNAIPAWTTNRIKRLVRQPKRYLCDTALAVAALRLDAAGVLADGDMLGRIIDTFVASQLHAELPACASRPRLYHLRQEQGRHEVDLIAEYGGGRVVGIEIKASGGPTASDARHLTWLRAEYGDRFICGLVLHTGPRRYLLGERIVAAPIASLWT